MNNRNINYSIPEPESPQGKLKKPLCTEPWEHYYILRRGILPCCYGNPILAPMSDWAEVWNSPALQEIRGHLRQGKLSPYCLKSPSCPIVQRVLAETKAGRPAYPRRPRLLRQINRLFLGIPRRIYLAMKKPRG